MTEMWTGLNIHQIHPQPNEYDTTQRMWYKWIKCARDTLSLIVVAYPNWHYYSGWVLHFSPTRATKSDPLQYNGDLLHFHTCE